MSGLLVQPRPSAVIGGLFLLSLLLFLALIPVPRVDGQLIGSDGVGYYVYVRSLVIDRDIDFANEYAYYGAAIDEPGLTPIGRVANKYPIGPAMLWLPFFLAAHLLALVGEALGFDVAADGFGYLYQAAISIGSICYGTLGFALAYRCASRLCSPASAVAAVVLLWLTSNAIYYMVFEPSMAHMVSLFSVALVLSIWFWWCRGPVAPLPFQAALLGAATGLVALVRLQDVIVLLLPYGYILVRLVRAWRHGRNGEAWGWLRSGLVSALVMMVVFVPQLVVWQRLYGTWTTSPYASDHDPAFRWFQPQIRAVLFSTFHGLFSWHPVFLLALGGLIVLGRRVPWLALSLGGVLALNVYVVAAWWSWWQGDSFGGRMFLSAMWIWVVGLGALIVWLRDRRWPRAPMLAGACLLIVWNGLSLLQYRLGFVPMSEPLTWQQMTVERVTLLWRLWAG